MGKLMVIAVDVETGTIPEPQPPSHPPSPDPVPRVVGIIDSNAFDGIVRGALMSGQAERVRKASSPAEPYQSQNPPTQVANILHTHNSPGCTWVIINGWPFCYS